ncbi:MAG: Membrane alanine aminopeptidase [Labilithrix sp.]|nr:Membrane alanine aminopeptidase [Labilithrix sp.]
MVRPITLFALLTMATLLAACPAGPPGAPLRPGADATPRTVLPPPREDGRLPALAIPLGYKLAIDADPRAATFHGTVSIDVELPAPTSHVVMHAHGPAVKLAQAVVAGRDARPRTARTSLRAATRETETEELVLSFDDGALPAGRATLTLAYDAPYGEELSGLYRVKENGLSYGFTQFEATDARRAFPCFDEPSFKTPFDVELTVPTGMTAVSNAPEVDHVIAGAKTTFRFARTKPLPTYLVAFAIGELEIRQMTRASGAASAAPPIRLVTTKGKDPASGALALEAAASLVDRLAQWFGIPYPYEKLDLVAVPEFAAGGMENAGLITARDQILLADPARMTVAARRGQALLIAHELAHQWFGDLVTAAWWDDLWLNEAFAQWMEAKIVDEWRPEFGAKNDALVASLAVMDEDALTTARAVRQKVVTTADADDAFDSITYEKGAAVLSTIERWIGEGAFQRGVREYLAKNAWKSVGADELLGALDRVSGKNVTQMAASYLDKPGVPEINAKLECDPGSRWHIELTQEPFRHVGSAAPPPEAVDPTWMVPVCALAQGETTRSCAELAEGAPSLVAGRKCPKWVHPNADALYYRFSMPDAELKKLAAGHAQLDLGQRLTVISNAEGALRAGKSKPGTLLDVLAAFDDDPARQVVTQVVAALSMLDLTIIEDAARPAFRKMALARLASHKRRLGWLPKKDAPAGDDALLRRDVLWAMGELAEDDATLREADEYAARWVVDPQSVEPDVAAVAVGLGSRRAGAARLAQLLERVKKGPSSADGLLALRALAGFDDPAMLTKAFDVLLTTDVKVSDMGYLFGAAYSRRVARPVMNAWVQAHWDELRKKLPGALGSQLVNGLATACTKPDLERARAFYEPRAAGMEGSQRQLAQALEGATLCTELRAKYAAQLTRDILNGKTR